MKNKHEWIAIAVFGLALSAAYGCAQEDGDPEKVPVATPAAAPVDKVRGIWIEPGVGIPQDAVWLACRTWKSTGLTCSTTLGRETAFIEVTSDHQDDCVATDGHFIGGSADPGLIRVHVACWPDAERSIEAGLTMAYILAHEFGHALGLQHVDDGISVMNWVLTYRLEPTIGDMAEFHRVWGDVSPP